ncbi:MAG: hypothetical protein F6K09_09855 [Merismopedia sp. SIO2A8]|nr:hypothetical protein [Merismopedia sp. SIO2A8]
MIWLNTTGVHNELPRIILLIGTPSLNHPYRSHPHRNHPPHPSDRQSSNPYRQVHLPPTQYRSRKPPTLLHFLALPNLLSPCPIHHQPGRHHLGHHQLGHHQPEHPRLEFHQLGHYRPDYHRTKQYQPGQQSDRHPILHKRRWLRLEPRLKKSLIKCHKKWKQRLPLGSDRFPIEY